MTRACIAIVDAARARVYAYDRDPDSGGARAPGAPAPSGPGALQELTVLINPGRRGHDLFSTTKPGIERGEPGAGTTDDHRDGHLAELERRFARDVIAEIDRIARERGDERVLVVASPAMLGELRGAGAGLARAGLEVEYVARDLARLTSPQIHDHLAQLRLVDPRPAFASG